MSDYNVDDSLSDCYEANDNIDETDSSDDSVLERVMIEQGLSSERTVKMFLDNELSKAKLMSETAIQISKMFADVLSRQRHIEQILRKDIEILSDKVSSMEKFRQSDLIKKNLSDRKVGFSMREPSDEDTDD